MIKVGEWRKSSSSDANGGGCVEIMDTADGGWLLRDSKDGGRGPVHTFTAAEKAAFLVGVRAGEFD